MNSFHRQAAGYTLAGEPYHEDHPVDHIEPAENGSNDVRDARLRFLEIIASWSALMHRAFSDDSPTITDLVPAFYGPAFALGLSCLGGIGMSEVADRFNISRAAISRASVWFSEVHNLPASRYQKEEFARTAYSKARTEQVKQGMNGALPPHRRAKPFKPMPELPP
jgi:hypothetical protein